MKHTGEQPKSKTWQTKYASGFIKAAVAQGWDEQAAQEFFLKYATEGQAALQGLPFAIPDLLGSVGLGAGAGGLGGAALGGAAGYFSGRDEDPQKDHRWRNAILGAGAGGVAGVAGGGYLGANHAFNNAKDVTMKGLDRDIASTESGWSNKLPNFLTGNTDRLNGLKTQRDAMNNVQLHDILATMLAGTLGK